jgi:FMN-dependent NADH-azoreductase
MWNFSIPYKLKQLIDLTAQRNYLFTYDGKEYGPCLNIPKALVVYTRGSAFREDSPIPPSFDHQAPYIDFWLRLIGVHEVCSVVVDNAWNQDRAQSEASLAAGKQSVERIVRGFWGLCEPIETGIGVCDNGRHLEILPASKHGPDALVHHKLRTM